MVHYGRAFSGVAVLSGADPTFDESEVLMDFRAGRWKRAALLAAAVALGAPAGAQAATKPDVTTGGASLVTFSSARISGSVNPNGAETTYFFQYGTTSIYGSET